MELLYKYFIIQFWSFKYNQKNSNTTAFTNSIVLMLLVFFFSCWIFYISIWGDPMFHNLRIFEYKSSILAIAYFGIGYQILKWLILKKMKFDVESGTSAKYSFMPTKRQRNICLVISVLICLLPFIMLVVSRNL